jgi:hypothetical protein
MLRTILSFVLLLSANVAFAHHGAGTFDLTKTIELSGKLTGIDLINPHSWLYFEGTGPDGKAGRFRCEMRSVHVLRRSGWSKDLFPIGQRINVTASPDRRDPNSCYLQTILFENGSRMDRYGQYVKAPQGGVREVRGPLVVPNVKRPMRRPTGEPNIAGEWAPVQNVMVDPRGTGGGMVQLTQLPTYKPGERAGGGGGARRGGGQPAGPRLYGGTELTEAGEKAAASFTQQDNPRFRCETTSIIFDWTFDGPVNRITQNKDTIVLEYGQFGLKRTVHMNMKQHPANVKPTRAGHSIGHWEGDTLVVDTTNFLPGVLNGAVRNSDKLHVIERFSLDTEKMALNRSYSAEDPVYLKGKYTGSDTPLYVADAPFAPGRCQELGFIDYSKEGQKKK